MFRDGLKYSQNLLDEQDLRPLKKRLQPAFEFKPLTEESIGNTVESMLMTIKPVLGRNPTPEVKLESLSKEPTRKLKRKKYDIRTKKILKLKQKLDAKGGIYDNVFLNVIGVDKFLKKMNQLQILYENDEKKMEEDIKKCYDDIEAKKEYLLSNKSNQRKVHQIFDKYKAGNDIIDRSQEEIDKNVVNMIRVIDMGLEKLKISRDVVDPKIEEY